MPKLILALHVSDAASVLLSASFRDRLAESGVTSLQVNVDDEAVAPALRFGPGTPVTAVVSVWTDADPAAIISAVAEAVDEPDVHAWRVTEKIRLDPLPTPDGERAPVYAQVALLRRPESMTREDYLTYWQVHHTPIAIRTQNTCGYIQNIVEEPLTPSTPDVAAIVEEHFPMAALTDPHEFYGSRGDEADLARRMTELMDSVVKFGAGDGLDVVPTSRYCWTLRT